MENDDLHYFCLICGYQGREALHARKDGKPCSHSAVLNAEDWNEYIRRLKERYRKAQDEVLLLQAELSGLLMAVERKYPGETRYQTAMRYIKQMEAPSTDAGQAKAAT